jgi:raffinose/stachyose/melibiose transport system permease protein
MKKGRNSSYEAILFVIPALSLYLLFVIAPWISAISFSFFNWDGIGSAVWNGFNNYSEVFRDPEQFNSIKHSLVLIGFFSVVPVTLGLVLAHLISNLETTSLIGRMSRVVIFLPQVLPLIAVGIAWKLIYSSQGVLNQFLENVGLGASTRGWLGDFNFALPAIGFVGIWLGTGLCLLLFNSGIQKIDQHLYEAVQLDGGGRIRAFTSVTVPSLRPEIRFASTITMIAALSGFDLVYVMTNGGPGGATLVPGLEVFRLAFSYNRFGQACALAVVLSLITFLFILLINRVLKDN